MLCGLFVTSVVGLSKSFTAVAGAEERLSSFVPKLLLLT
jgi:hypothetical protein